MKRLLIFVVLSAPVLLWFLLPSVSAAGAPISSKIMVTWELRAGGPATALVATGSPLEMHPSYYDFKHGVLDEITSQVPTDIRNAWPFHSITVSEEGHKPEEEVRAELANALVVLNERRDEIAAAEGLPVPPDFSLTTDVPDSVFYEVYNGTVKCVHNYLVSLGGVQWGYSDPAVGAAVEFRITLTWESRIPNSDD